MLNHDSTDLQKVLKMKIRLSWKLFGVMMFDVVLIVGVMVVIMNLLRLERVSGIHQSQ